MNKDWTEYDGTNPPTDTKRRIYVAFDDGREQYFTLGWDDVAINWKRRTLAYMYLPSYTPPEPTLLPCRCGGEAVYYDEHHGVMCQDCENLVHSEHTTEARRMWNAAMKRDTVTVDYSKLREKYGDLMTNDLKGEYRDGE